jgi:hypothetical protein
LITKADNLQDVDEKPAVDPLCVDPLGIKEEKIQEIIEEEDVRDFLNHMDPAVNFGSVETKSEAPAEDPLAVTDTDAEVINELGTKMDIE